MPDALITMNLASMSSTGWWPSSSGSGSAPIRTVSVSWPSCRRASRWRRRDSSMTTAEKADAASPPRACVWHPWRRQERNGEQCRSRQVCATAGEMTAATAAGVTIAFVIQALECMRAFPSERTVQSVPTSPGHNCRWRRECITEADGGRTRRHGSPQGLSSQPYRVRAQARCVARSDDIRLMPAFASSSGHVFKGPRMPMHWSPPEASHVGSCDQVAGDGPERLLPHFAQRRWELSRS